MSAEFDQGSVQLENTNINLKNHAERLPGLFLSKFAEKKIFKTELAQMVTIFPRIDLYRAIIFDILFKGDQIAYHFGITARGKHDKSLSVTKNPIYENDKLVAYDSQLHVSVWSYDDSLTDTADDYNLIYITSDLTEINSERALRGALNELEQIGKTEFTEMQPNL